MILYGAPVKEKIKEDLIKKTKKLKKRACLAVVQVGEREDSNIYIKQKQKFGEEIEVLVLVKRFGEEIKEEDLILEIEKLNEEENINGIIIQLPLPESLNAEKILHTVSIKKDADGLRRGSGVISATARGVMALLDYYQIPIKDKKVTVIGQSILAGKPISDEFEKRGAKVFRCDISTKNIPEISRSCDILISATGQVALVTKEFVNKKQVVVDVGINKIDGKLFGDVVFLEVEPIVFAITPVPGGIGPLTVACLFENLLDLILN